jgi:hypothetical protein
MTMPPIPPEPGPIRDLLLDDRLASLHGPLVAGGLRVRFVSPEDRPSFPGFRSETSSTLPALITAAFRDWVVPGESPRELSASLVNVRSLLHHADGGAAMLIRALTEDIPAHDLFWMDFDPDGYRHMVLFAPI